jgi:hypothetical protein
MLHAAPPPLPLPPRWRRIARLTTARVAWTLTLTSPLSLSWTSSLTLAAAASLAACSKASDEADAKRTPVSPPPPGPPKVAQDWRVEVTIDGAPARALTAADLERIKPDFADSERRGWRIETLVPQAAGATAVIADGPSGVSVLYEVPAAGAAGATGAVGEAPALRPALFLTRRGEVIAAAVDPENPLPRYHGKGGQMRRIGDSQPRLLGVTRLRIHHKAAL